MGLDPLTLALVGATVGGQILQGIAAKEQADSDAAIAEFNAQVEEQEAKQIEARGTFESIRQAKEAARRQSQLAANIGLTGAVSTEGAPLLAKAQQQTEDELENLGIGFDARIGVSRAKSRAETFRLEKKAAKKRGRAAIISGFVGAAGTVVGEFNA